MNELQADWADALAHVGMLQEQLDAPAEPAAADEDPEEIEGVSDLDSEHALAEPNLSRTTLLPAVPLLWATSTTSRRLRLVLDSSCFLLL